MSVLIAPLIIGIIFIILIIVTPYIFKPIFKIENFFGYCSGLCCFIVVCIVLIAIIIVEAFALAAYLTKNQNINFNYSDSTDIDYLLNLSFGIRIVIWLVDVINKVAIFP